MEMYTKLNFGTYLKVDLTNDHTERYVSEAAKSVGQFTRKYFKVASCILRLAQSSRC